MTATVAIPGRRITDGESFNTDWVPRGGDCVLLRVQVLVAAGGDGDVVTFSLATRGENGTTVTPITPTSTAISQNSVGIYSCIYLATSSSTAGNGAQEQVRVVVGCTGGGGGYFVVRVFPLIFFDTADAT